MNLINNETNEVIVLKAVDDWTSVEVTQREEEEEEETSEFVPTEPEYGLEDNTEQAQQGEEDWDMEVEAAEREMARKAALREQDLPTELPDISEEDEDADDCVILAVHEVAETVQAELAYQGWREKLSRTPTQSPSVVSTPPPSLMEDHSDVEGEDKIVEEARLNAKTHLASYAISEGYSIGRCVINKLVTNNPLVFPKLFQGTLWDKQIVQATNEVCEHWLTQKVCPAGARNLQGRQMRLYQEEAACRRKEVEVNLKIQELETMQAKQQRYFIQRTSDYREEQARLRKEWNTLAVERRRMRATSNSQLVAAIAARNARNKSVLNRKTTNYKEQQQQQQQQQYKGPTGMKRYKPKKNLGPHKGARPPL
jgi:hypothetical protein